MLSYLFYFLLLVGSSFFLSVNDSLINSLERGGSAVAKKLSVRLSAWHSCFLTGILIFSLVQNPVHSIANHKHLAL